MSVQALLMALLMGATPPPEITEIYPTPLALGSTVDITGEHFAPDETTVALISDLDPLQSAVAQSIVYVLETTVRFDVSESSILGSATLRVTTPSGQAETKVEVVPAPPVIADVTPDPLILGELATITGSNLGEVEEVTLGGTACEVSAQNAGLIVCMAPLSTELIGAEVPISVTGPHGEATRMVEAAPPTPVIEQLAPNPVRQGDLLTLKGTILPHLLEVTVANQPAVIVSASESELVIAVPMATPPGAAEVVVWVGNTPSAPAGPLWIEPADTDRPGVDGVYPAAIVVGGSAWAVGKDLDTVDWSTGGIAFDSCDDKSCRLTFGDLGPGPQSGAIGGDTGTSVISVQLLEDTGQPRPILTSAEPDPAFVGEALTLKGEGLFEVSHVLIGGVVQPIDYLGTDEIRVIVADETPRGAERAFVAGASASEALSVVVLDPFPIPGQGSEGDAEEGADVTNSSEEDAGPRAQPSDTGNAPEEEGDTGGSEPSTEAEGQGISEGDADRPETPVEGGCQGSPQGGHPLLLYLIVLALAPLVTRRRALV